MVGGKIVRRESSANKKGGNGGNVVAGQKRNQSSTMTPGEREVIERVVKERAAKIREKRGMNMF